MKEATHLNVFDFDDTLFRVPNYTVAEAKGSEPYTWFDSSESLDQRFNIRGISNTVQHTGDIEAVNVLITHRVEECKDRVNELLAETGIEFDESYFLGRGSHKADTVLQILERISVESITIFEDTLWEVICYARILDSAKISQTVRFAFVDKSKVIYIEFSEALVLANTIEFERLKLL